MSWPDDMSPILACQGCGACVACSPDDADDALDGCARTPVTWLLAALLVGLAAALGAGSPAAALLTASAIS